MNGAELAQLVRAAAADESLVTPEEISDAVAKALTVREVRGALALTLPGFVRLVVAAKSASAGPPAQNSRTRASAVRSWAESIRTRRVFVGDVWKVLADCTGGDLRVVAGARERQAHVLAADAARWSQLADRMDSVGAVTVADLPDDVLRGGLAA